MDDNCIWGRALILPIPVAAFIANQWRVFLSRVQSDGQWQAIVIGIAITATVLVSQQLTKKDNAIMLSFLKETFNNPNTKPGDPPGPIAEIPDIEEPGTLHEEMPDEVPPSRAES